MPFSISELHVIFAEDDLVFREISVPAIMKVGIPEARILQAEDGGDALQHLQSLQGGNPSEPIVMLLDVRMPGMDGIQCARKVKELKEQGKLKRLPFLVCCSAAVEQVSFGGEEGFHITMPKPFSDREVDLVIGKSQEWWQSGGGMPSGGLPAKSDCVPFDVSKMDMIVGDNEPICRMALITSLTLLGADEELIKECDTKEEVAMDLKEAQATPGPLLVFLGNTGWVSAVSALGALRRKPFVVSTSVDGDRNEAFNVTLPRQFNQDDLRKVLEQYKEEYSSSA